MQASSFNATLTKQMMKSLIEAIGYGVPEHLKFTSHLEELSKRLSRKIGVLMRLNISKAWPSLKIFYFARRFGTFVENLIAGGVRDYKKERLDQSVVINAVHTINFL